jgi:uncharacterized membrane protein (DUF373 family)
MLQNKESDKFDDKALIFFSKFEKYINYIVTAIISFIILISIIRISQKTYTLFIIDFFEPQEISFSDYQVIFGSILTLLISLEFMNSILKVIKQHDIKVLALDVALITGLAISRKLIIFDYDKHEAIEVFAFGFLLLAIAVYYFLIRKIVKPRS